VAVVLLSIIGASNWWWSTVPLVLAVRLGGLELVIRRCGLLATDETVQVRTMRDRKAMVIPAERMVAYRSYPDGTIEIAYLDAAEPADDQTYSVTVMLEKPEEALEEMRFRYGSRPLEEVSEAELGTTLGGGQT
jgi:hypothetical protein